MTETLIETARAILVTVFFIVVMPALAFGGFGLMMHGVNIASDAVCMAGLFGMPIGWIALYCSLKSDAIL
ncbi:hypothetical protein G6L16_008765 [Agrobacterium tumefaciens]|uniref:hypothetical protein n=1 Tax=Agrobacterium tumefaciens TaxID=358 RepID=UPI00157462F1|nr:hypothetical protein [Agrobacterium tumefaciens]NSZ63429.1 hypothetical protein [Agrobacterium tumefaciens]NTA69799.1 hypothetical protein [Agrobacterium tumefaciens]WIE36945.1 hypothetical protein G6L16_008765 [Agrobacterium tumefaciens]